MPPASSFKFKNHIPEREAIRRHIESLQPCFDEVGASTSIASGLLTSDFSWPSLIRRQIHRYMHNHNLYQLFIYNIGLFSELVALISASTGLPNTKELVGAMRELVEASAGKWRDEGLLVYSGTTLRKSPLFERSWDAQLNSADRSAKERHRELPGNDPTGCHGPTPSDVRKVSAPYIARAPDNKLSQRGSIHTIANIKKKRRMSEDEGGSIQIPKQSCIERESFQVTEDNAPTNIADGDCVILATSVRSIPSDNNQVESQLVNRQHKEISSAAQNQRRTSAPHSGVPTVSSACPSDCSACPSDCSACPSDCSACPSDCSACTSDCSACTKERATSSNEIITADTTARQGRFTIQSMLSGPPSSGEHAKCPELTSGAQADMHSTDLQIARSASPQAPASNAGRSTTVPPSLSRSTRYKYAKKPDDFIARTLASVGILLIPRRVTGIWAELPIGCLMSQTVIEFFDSYSHIAGLDAPMLRFEMLDVTAQWDRVRDVLPGDSRSFETLKRTIWDNIPILLKQDPPLSSFKVCVKHPPEQVGSKAAIMDPTPVLAIKQLNDSESVVQIAIRIQKDANGTFSHRHNSAVLNLKTTNVEFFAWFAEETGYASPSGPPELRFTFKDAMPTTKSSVITLADEEHFERMKRDIRPQCDRARTYMPQLFEFAILITVPRWSSKPVREW